MSRTSENLEKEEFLLPEHEGNRETNDPQGGHSTPEEDTSNDICPKAEPISAGEPSLVAFVKCQPISSISEHLQQADTTENRTRDANSQVKDQFNETGAIILRDACGTRDSVTLQGCSQKAYEGLNAPSECVRQINKVDRNETFNMSPDPSCSYSDSEYSTACQVLNELIDEVIKKIELTGVEQRCTGLPAFREEKDDIQNCNHDVSKNSAIRMKAQLNVSFASPLESCCLYTPSVSASTASTADITSETDECESEEKTSKQATTFSDEKNQAEDLIAIISQNNYSDQATGIDFSTTKLDECVIPTADNCELKDESADPSHLDESSVKPGQLNTMPETIVSESKTVSDIGRNNPLRRDREQGCKKMINCEIVETDDNSSQTNNSYETMQITPRDCQIHYPAKQIHPKIEQDTISSSCDLFGSIDNQQNTYAAGVEITSSVDLLPCSPQVSSKLTCHGNEMENQKQSDNSDPVITLQSTRDLPIPGLAKKQSPAVNNTDVEHIVHRSSDQSAKFVSSAELFSQAEDQSLVRSPNAQMHNNELCKDSVEGSPNNQWERMISNPLSTEPYKEIVKLIFDHPDARCSPKTNEMRGPKKFDKNHVVKPETSSSKEEESQPDNEHKNETPFDIKLPKGPESCKEARILVNSPNSFDNTLPKLGASDDKDIDQICRDGVPEEKTLLKNTLLGKCHANKEVDSNDGTRNIGTKTTINSEARLHENHMTNDSELFTEEASPSEEVRKIDENHVEENHLIDGHIGFSLKDSTDHASSEWPLTEGIMNVSYQGEEKHSSCYQAVNPENQMTNELCVGPMQIKPEELQAVSVGLSNVEENFSEGINSDVLLPTSMPSSEKGLLPQVTATLQNTEEKPVESIPLKLDQSSTHEFKCTETTSLRPESEDLVSPDQCEETINKQLTGIQISVDHDMKEPQENCISSGQSVEVSSQRRVQNSPVVQYPPHDDDDFPDSGISNSSQLQGEAEPEPVICMKSCEGGDANTSSQGTSQNPVDGWETAAGQSETNSPQSGRITNADVQHLVYDLVNAVCSIENAQQLETKGLEMENNDETCSPPSKIRKS